ncbi:hypothetical protein RIF23_20760, partial [Lipingzhangella sp. LS1_29]|nr:hypothetical protein [Lipingzhangella rawalii]
LPQRAADLRRRLDNDRSLADGGEPGDPDVESVNVVITELRAMVTAGLLDELAARLSPGAAFGPSRDGEPLAEVARALSKELRSQTFLG